ncbi:TonB-dependent receptor [Parvularcula sp. LCG005]|uniref:TonB-dependent receptor n=1 Tax=Parvularcula sp. LCG005 TaxID=3078805 RepID=UPI0029422D84|nr:TonB-dependent receptor [Parvularcula sp. LCG005]WOI54270.1 TonB-dependent receptor [Parvularcula sp. LCG005]
MKKFLMLGTSLAMTTAFAAPALAQDDMDEDVITVTATKREQTLQEVPVAVSVVDDEVIEQAQINDLMDLQSVVPSLRVSQLERSGNTTFIIRGFGNGANNVGIEPSVGVFIDGVYRSRSAASISDLPDLQRVEVLRGPQSTLFGKNASAGVISFVTAEPQFTLGGSLEATLGNENQRILKGLITGPINDTSAFSLSGTMHKRDGYAENTYLGEDLNERNRWAVRAQYLYEPVPEVSLRIIADLDRLDEDCCYAPNLFDGPTGNAIRAVGGTVSSDPYSYETMLDIQPTNEVENWGTSAHLDADWGFADFTSITSYREQSVKSNGDVDFTDAFLIASNLNDVNVDTVTQEFRLTSKGNERLDWMVGAYLFDEQVENKSNVIFGNQFRDYGDVLAISLGQPGALDQLEAALSLPNGTFFAPNTGSREFLDQENDSWSVFAQADYELTDRLTATVGLNYTEDEKRVQGYTINDDVFASLDLEQVGNGLITQQAFAQAFFDATGFVATPSNIALVEGLMPGTQAAVLAGASAFASAVDSVPCSASNPPPACNPLLTLQPFQFLPPFVAFPNEVEDGKTKDDNVSYTVRLAYELTPRINIYGSVATGFKASSFNLSRDSKPFPSDIAALDSAGLLVPNLSPGTRYAGPEESMVYELGMKAQFDRGSLNVTVFDQTIDGFQSVIFTGTGFGLTNAGEQSTTGIEIDATFQPIDPLTLTFSGTFLDPVYDSFVGANGVDETGAQATVDLSGTQPAGIHTMSLFFSALYETPIGDDKMLFIRGAYQYEDEVQVVENVPASVASREVNLLNGSVGINWDNGVRAFVWGRNLTDEQFYQSAFPTTAQNGSYNGYPNQPRSYGVTLRKEW